MITMKKRAGFNKAFRKGGDKMNVNMCKSKVGR